MPAPSPSNISDPTVRFTIYTNGSQIPDTIMVVSLHTIYEINRIPWAEITLVDGDVSTATFEASSSETFLPGNAIRITAGYGDGAEKEIFSGLIVKQAVKIRNQSSNLVVTCKHKAVSMTFNKKEEAFFKQTDSDIISSIIANYGLSAEVKATTPINEGMFQKLATDWDFILSRADVCGMVVNCTTESIIVSEPTLSSAAVLTITYGDSIVSFNAELNAEKQPPALEASTWDSGTLEAIKSSATEPTLNAHGNVSAKDLSAKLSQKQLTLNSGSPMTQESLKEWADSSLLRARLAALRGNVTFTGSSLVVPGSIIVLEGVGDRFNGQAYVSSVEHMVNDGVWLTTVKFGLDQKPAADFDGFSYTPATGQLPAIHGLQVAVVKKLSEDPLAEFRIQITLSANSSATVDLWARMSNFYATATAGSMFLPEVGDEVVVGFLDSNPGFPVILGSLYSKKNAAEVTPADNNNYLKGITTKAKLKISFDDEKKITTFTTPAGNKITLSDDAKEIDITDQNSNSIKMTASGIEIKSSKDLNLKATGNITLDATGKVSLTAKQDLVGTGLNVNMTANIGFTAKGSATAEISASGQTTVKGGIVMIN